MTASSDGALGDGLTPADSGVQTGSGLTANPADHWSMSELTLAVFFIEHIARVAGGDIAGFGR